MSKITLFISLFTIIYSPPVVKCQGMTQAVDTPGAKKVWNQSIGLNISPVMVAAMGGYSQTAATALIYKRNFGAKSALRTGLSGYYYGTNENFYSGIIWKNDSLMLREVTAYSENQRWFFHLGFETVTGGSKVKSYVGCDIVAGRSKTAYDMHGEIFRKDSTVVTGYETWVFDRLATEITPYRISTQNRYAGFLPFVGVMFPINERFEFSFDIGATFLFCSGLAPYYGNDGSVNLRPISKVVMDSDALIRNVSFHFRF